MTDTLLAEISALLRPCPPPDIAGGDDLCLCGTGEVWPCEVTQAAWLARNLARNAEVRRAVDAARQQMRMAGEG